MPLSFSSPLDAAAFSFSLVFIFLFIGLAVLTAYSLYLRAKFKDDELDQPGRNRDRESIVWLNVAACIFLCTHFILFTVVLAKEKETIAPDATRRLATSGIYIMSDFMRRSADILAFCAVIVPIYRLHKNVMESNTPRYTAPKDEEGFERGDHDRQVMLRAADLERHQGQRKRLNHYHGVILVLFVCLFIISIIRIVVQARFNSARNASNWFFSPRWVFASPNSKAYRITAHIDIAFFLLTAIMIVIYGVSTWVEASWARLLKSPSTTKIILPAMLFFVASLSLLTLSDHVVSSLAPTHPSINTSLSDFLEVFLTGILYTALLFTSTACSLYPL